MSEEATYTIDELHRVTVPAGRCPHCGRPSEASEAKVFAQLREQAASANSERDEATGQARELEEERNLLAAQLNELRARAAQGD